MSYSDTAIRVENLSKLYYIGEAEKYYALRDVFSDFFRSLFRLGGRKKKVREQIWALKDVSFEVKRGEVVGIIGRNGAGKSTLLKILSRITEPTQGYAEIHGRVGSLLEVGTGFHPELTGRENIYFSGAILGMKKKEIDKKFDEIVAFAEVEKFIDTPVKYYSSGMYVRLAFAVAAHLEPEILLVDEVLAVGDAAFQRKCLGKMGEVAKGGRTVLFVSHNMGMITSLCPRAILLENGRIVADGVASETVLTYYTRDRASPYKVDFTKMGQKVGDEFATLLEAHIEDMYGNVVSEVDMRQPFKVKMRYALHKNVPRSPYPNFHFFDSRGEYVFVSSGNSDSSKEVGIYEAECTVPGNLLNNGVYFIGLALTFTHSGIHVSFFERNALSVSVKDPIDETLDTLRSGYSGPIPGPVRPKLEWKISRIQ
ncbi:MAG: ABC transporter ATP-binding protein [Candidatus Calescibacterium sp.]|nr:ABC transporter ATP-binding protein [Candidatus Calescibacterium sp.]MCX7734994.1 ABC transporter ATP-binding protein [bacterium]MDW8087812.1 ABC transporter ATP-binding protein [Candidatus Calescibacterium sp.]